MSKQDTLEKNMPKMDLFIASLAITGNVCESYKAAGIGCRETVYQWRRKWESFKKRWDDALEDYSDLIRETVRKRAIDDKNDRMLMRMAEAHCDEYKRDSVKVDHSGALKLVFSGNIDPEDV